MNTRSSAERGRTARWWYLLLLVPFIAILWVGSYASWEPSILGVPFFYWYQIAWIVISALIVWGVYAATRTRSHE